MNLFEQDIEKIALPADPAEPDAVPAPEAAELVLDIDGDAAEPLKEPEPVPDLRGATKTLPAQEKILEAVEAAWKEETSVPAEESAPAPKAQEPLSSVSYASVAQAMVNAKKEPTGRFERDAVDDETLLAELYALIGDKKPAQPAAPAAKEAAPAVPSRPVSRPEARITAETLQDAPEEFYEIEEDTSGVPGWLKGAFILLISLLLSAMTFYAVASDVIGEIF